jgi:hypothetical protein
MEIFEEESEINPVATPGEADHVPAPNLPWSYLSDYKGTVPNVS